MCLLNACGTAPAAARVVQASATHLGQETMSLIKVAWALQIGHWVMFVQQPPHIDWWPQGNATCVRSIAIQTMHWTASAIVDAGGDGCRSSPSSAAIVGGPTVGEGVDSGDGRTTCMSVPVPRPPRPRPPRPWPLATLSTAALSAAALSAAALSTAALSAAALSAAALSTATLSAATLSAAALSPAALSITAFASARTSACAFPG